MSWKIKKSKLNLTIDISMFVVLMAIAGIGFMIKYVLVPGFKRNEIYGRNVELYYLGLDRHAWGNIHLILSFILLFLLLLHIIFHWKQIVCIFKGMVAAKTWRIAFTSIFVVVSFVFGVIPLFVKPEIQQSVLHHYGQSGHNSKGNAQEIFSITPIKSSHDLISVPIHAYHSKKDTFLLENKPMQNYKHDEKNTIEVYGYMTLDDVAKKYNIPSSELALCIHVPRGHTNEKLGRLRKQYSFHLNDLREYIASKTIQQ